MSEKVDYQVGFEYTSEGAAKVSADLDKLLDKVDKLARENEMSEKAQDQLSGSILRTQGSIGKMEKATSSATSSLPTLRYALYDVASTAGAVSTAIAGVGAGALVMSSSYERAFTNVERTTLSSASATNELRGQLMQLTREVPESWGFVTEIASVGAQLGIATEELGGFTETVTRFATVTGVSAQESAKAFGSLGELLDISAGQYEQLGSAIAYVGVNSVATDEEIIKMSNRLAASAANAGFTAQEVVALSGALASLRVAPERAQGVMEVYFKVLNTAIAEGGPRLEMFAQAAGVSADQVGRLVAEDPTKFFRDFAGGLGQLDPVSLTQALSDLGLSGIRAGEVFTRVSGNLHVFDKALADSNDAFTSGTHLMDAYGLVVDDLASKWQIFVNGLAEFGAAVGDVFAPAAKAVLDIATSMVNALSDVANSPIGPWVLGLAAVFGSVILVISTLIGVAALAGASMAAMATATAQLGVAAGGSIFSITGLRTAFQTLATAAGLSTRAVNVFKVALASSGIGLLVVALGTLATAFANTGLSAEQAFDKYAGTTAGLTEALQADMAAFEAAGGVAGESFTVLSQAVDAANPALQETRENLSEVAAFLGVDMPAAVNASSDALESQTAVIGENATAWLKSTLLANEAFANLINDSGIRAAMEQTGVTFDEMLQVAMLGGEEALVAKWADLAKTNDAAASLFHSGFVEWIIKVGQSIAQAWSSLTSNIGSIGDVFAGAFGDAGAAKRVEAIGQASQKAMDKIWSSPVMKSSANDFNALLSGTVNQVKSLGKAALNPGSSGMDSLGSGMDDAANAAGKLKAEVRTLLDYAGDLAKVWGRAFDIRFSGQETLDNVTSQFIKIREENERAAKAIRDLKNDIRGLNSDISIQEYYLSIAIEYGDTQRAQAIEAELAKKRAELADKTSDLQKEQDKAQKSLTGNTSASIEHRKSITDLVKSYQSHIEALAASGMSEQQLLQETAKLKQEFIAQATQLGYNRNEILLYASAFDDVTVAIKNVPRSITVTANANPAIQALNEMKAAADRANGAVGSLKGSLGSGFPTGGVNTGPIVAAGLAAEAATLRKKLMDAQFAVGAAKGSALAPFTESGLRSRLSQLQSWGYASGGYTGAGGMYEPAGVVHRGEYVIPKRDVNQSTGLPKQDALGRLMQGQRGYATGGYVRPAASSGSGFMHLAPASLQQLAMLMHKYIVVDGQVIGSTTSDAYAQSASVGAY